MKFLKNRTMLIVSLWGYPFGGGEEYLYQTALWSSNMGMKTYWLCFSSPESNYTEFSVISIDGFKIIKIPGGFNPSIARAWIKILNPDIVHHQGHLRKSFHDICFEARIPFVTGIHFWSGIIELNHIHNNINILQNSHAHTIDPDFIKLYDSPHCTFYSVSKFVTECVEKITDKKIDYTVFSGSSKNRCFVEGNNPIDNKYVTLINIHLLKGGELILFLLQNLPQIPFIVIRTEGHSDKLDDMIKNEILVGNKNGNAHRIYFERIDDMKFIYAQTRIFLAPSLVDETFCRTVNEAMMNHIPVITSGRGNLKYLVEGAGICIDINNRNDYELWKNKIDELYHDESKLNQIIANTKLKYEDFSENICQKMFFEMIYDVIKKSKNSNIMIIAPWCDQGLGIQARNYYHLLNNNGYRTHIFSYKSYSGKSSLEMQKNPQEWLIDNIYYSANDREHILDIELLNFVRKYNIGKCIIPETCWFRIFEIAKFMKNNNVKCYAIPNIEIVRRDEISKHKLFHKILCNNLLCKSIFDNNGITNNQYIGYGISNPGIIMKHKNFDDEIKFLFIGGMNAFSRKHILNICRSFCYAYDILSSMHNNTNKIKLTCTIQKTNLLEVDDVKKLDAYIGHPGIEFIQSHLSYNDIINLYHSHHVSIQVSKHEGLGLGFYEALATGTPVISLNTQPHNEIITDNVNGWLIDCQYETMVDNPNSFIKSAIFDHKVLGDKFLKIINENFHSIYNKLIIDYNKRLSDKCFIEKIILSLND